MAIHLNIRRRKVMKIKRENPIETESQRNERSHSSLQCKMKNKQPKKKSEI